ncbi:MAG: putative helix-destabilizing protein [Prokaryotic dsDNA virus sp.]|nr:MAG: putative helix-destabilizing protein [Prokaryotic dsDNA virus sp.]|tara:strand:- start:35746 stop:36381 length:636 start_codon:yes stop_codon:yes gene_type:complete
MVNRTKYLTPPGKLGWVSLQEPDTKFADETDPNDKGVFKAMLRLPKDDAQTDAFIDTLQAAFAEFVAEEERRTGRKIKVHEDGLPWSDEEDRETGEPTGNVLIRTKLKARVFVKSTGKVFDQRPKAFDTQGKLIPEMPAVGPGSKVKIAGQVNCWHTSKAGMSLWLEAVQIIDLVESNFGGDTADSFGFQQLDGYVAEAEETFEEATSGDF